MAGPTFISDVIKGLKSDDEYGTLLILGCTTPGEVNFRTGQTQAIVREIVIEQAIRLPSKMSYKFLQSIGVNVKALDLLAGTIQILIDRDDLPENFDVKVASCFAIFENRKYTVVETEVYDYAVVLFVRDVGARPPGSTISSGLALRHTLTVQVN